MLTIHKYPLRESTAVQSVAMPVAAEILSCQVQRGTICLWATVYDDPGQPMYWRKFIIRGTGYPLDGLIGPQHVGTVQMGDLVWHVFEVQQ